jgi:hypothetical protein
LIADEVERSAELPDMPPVHIALEDIRQAIRKTQNWKARGADDIHNYCWKYFKCTYDALVQHFQQILQEQTLTPRFLTVRATYILPKSWPASHPKKLWANDMSSHIVQNLYVCHLFKIVGTPRGKQDFIP